MSSRSLGYSVNIPFSWRRERVSQDEEWLFVTLSQGDLLARAPSGLFPKAPAAAAVHTDFSTTTQSTNLDAYLAKLAQEKQAQSHVEFEVLDSQQVEGPGGSEGLSVRWQLDYFTDVGFQVAGKGTWRGEWLILLLDNRMVIVEVTVLTDFADIALPEFQEVVESFTITRLDVPIPGAPVVNTEIIDFSLEDLAVAVGTKVTWNNEGPTIHTSTSGANLNPDGIWDSGIMQVADIFSFTFNAVGVFPYFCQIHPFQMQATVEVVPE